MKVTVIDYGAGNLFSIEKAFKRLGCGVIITNDLSKVKKSDKLVLPGVGHFGLGVQNIEKLKLKEIIYQKLEIDKIPILGICLGMQLLLDFSEEGNCNGLGLINLRAKKFDLAEICITSGAQIELNNSQEDEIKVETFKAKGKKCKICWKIRDETCERHGKII